MARMTTERFFGGVDNRIEYLRQTIQWIAEEEPTKTDLVAWIQQNTSAGSESLITRNLNFLVSIGLIEQSDGIYRPTNKGDAFWRNNEPQVIYEGLATAVDGFREMLRAIVAGNRSLPGIQEQLQAEYPDHVLPEGVVTKHLGWLRSLGLIAEQDGSYSIPIEDGQFEVGKRYSRWFIHDALKGERYKGIATPSNHPLIFIFTGESGDNYGYEDEFLADDTFLYTGEGTEGDMTMSGGNRAIRDHQANGDSIHLFENSDLPWIVTYRGEYEYLTHRQEELPDENGNLRDAYRFHLAPVGGTAVEIDDGTPATLSDEALFAKAKESSPSGAATSTGSTTQSTRRYTRSEIVREFALRMADGICQGCGEEAPFRDNNGQPYLEVHHLTRRSDGGPDSPKNVIALCPNCHRRVHDGRDGDEFNQQLQEKVEGRNNRLMQ